VVIGIVVSISGLGENMERVVGHRYVGVDSLDSETSDHAAAIICFTRVCLSSSACTTAFSSTFRLTRSMLTSITITIAERRWWRGIQWVNVVFTTNCFENSVDRLIGVERHAGETVNVRRV
jgi:hypothetical protein